MTTRADPSTLLLVTKIITISSMGIFAGSAINYNTIIMPSLRQFASGSSLAVWSAMYMRAKPFQMVTISLSAIGATVLYLKTRDSYYLAGALLMAGIIPYNKALVYPINKKLLDIRKHSKEDPNVENMMSQWDSLQFGRSLISYAALSDMVQSLNFQGILQTFRVLISPRLMVPNLIVRDIRDINFEQLHKAGIIALAFDKDNCLTRPYGNDLHPPFKDAWKDCREVYKDQVVIVSNSAGTNDDKDYKQAKAIEKALQVSVLRHQLKKPSGGEELLNHFSGINPGRIAFVGDRALTDVVFGNNHGMLTILTRDIVSEEGDNPMAVKIRKMEHRVLAFLDRMSIRQKDHPIHIDLHAVVMQRPPPPMTKDQAIAQAAVDKARVEQEQQKQEDEKKSRDIGEEVVDGKVKSSSASHSTSRPFKDEV
ncbi:hypothetical protein BGZ46_003280 [Entomortierella lignicola]|nr:hypothetical protein BGZ46_003280 [Entomortierella lignicola]